MTAARWSRSALDVVPATPKVRWGHSGLVGTVVEVPTVRWGHVGLVGAAAVVVQPFADVTVEPESTVTITASLAGGGTADSWTFRRVSGPSVGILGSGATRTLTAPSTAPPAGGVLVIGVQATLDGTTSPERLHTINLLPQVSWVWNGEAFVGAPRTYL